VTLGSEKPCTDASMERQIEIEYISGCRENGVGIIIRKIIFTSTFYIRIFKFSFYIFSSTHLQQNVNRTCLKCTSRTFVLKYDIVKMPLWSGKSKLRISLDAVRTASGLYHEKIVFTSTFYIHIFKFNFYIFSSTHLQQNVSRTDVFEMY